MSIWLVIFLIKGKVNGDIAQEFWGISKKDELKENCFGMMRCLTQ